MALRVPLQDLDEAAGAVRRGLGGVQGRHDLERGGVRGLRVAGEERLEEVAGGLGRAQDLLGQADAEGLLQAGQELHPAQAVEPEVALQR